MTYPFKINPTRIEINLTQIENQSNPRIKPNLSFLPLHCSRLLPLSSLTMSFETPSPCTLSLTSSLHFSLASLLLSTREEHCVVLLLQEHAPPFFFFETQRSNIPKVGQKEFFFCYYPGLQVHSATICFLPLLLVLNFIYNASRTLAE